MQRGGVKFADSSPRSDKNSESMYLKLEGQRSVEIFRDHEGEAQPTRRTPTDLWPACDVETRQPSLVPRLSCTQHLYL